MEASPKISAPLFRVLKCFSLEHHFPKLEELGFSHSLGVLANTSYENLRDLSERLHLTQEERSKFSSMIELLKVVLPESQAAGHHRSTSSMPSKQMSSHSRRNSFGGDMKRKQKMSEKLYEIISKYQQKEFEERRQKEEQSKLVSELEEAKRKINELTEELGKQKESTVKVEEDKVGSEPPLRASVVRKEVGVSYDSFKLRSTIAHIDIEEMCRCLAKALYKHISHSQAIKNSREGRLPMPSLPDFFEDNSADQAIDRGIMVEPHIIQLFEAEFNEDSVRVPSESDIYYFVKNIIFRSKMEKETSIICLIYIERMIARTGLYINEKNWKKITFIALTIASKVWDDESYENIHFAKVFTRYSLKEINNLERLFLGLIDYDVGIKKSEYAKYYFVLRTYAGKTTRSFPLRALDVDTVRKLQSNAYNAETRFKNIHSNVVYKSI